MRVLREAEAKYAIIEKEIGQGLSDVEEEDEKKKN